MKTHIVSYKMENKKIPHCKNSSKHQSKIAEISKIDIPNTHIFLAWYCHFNKNKWLNKS